MAKLSGISTFRSICTSHVMWKTFRPYVLKHNHRTGNRYEFAQTLNRVRIGQPTDDDMKTLYAIARN